jgi:hypothetical protein
MLKNSKLQKNSKKYKKFRKILKISENVERFRIDSCSVFISSAFYPIKRHKKNAEKFI